MLDFLSARDCTQCDWPFKQPQHSAVNPSLSVTDTEAPGELFKSNYNKKQIHDRSTGHLTILKLCMLTTSLKNCRGNAIHITSQNNNSFYKIISKSCCCYIIVCLYLIWLERGTWLVYGIWYMRYTLPLASSISTTPRWPSAAAIMSEVRPCLSVCSRGAPWSITKSSKSHWPEIMKR